MMGRPKGSKNYKLEPKFIAYAEWLERTGVLEKYGLTSINPLLLQIGYREHKVFSAEVGVPRGATKVQLMKARKGGALRKNPNMDTTALDQDLAEAKIEKAILEALKDVPALRPEQAENIVGLLQTYGADDA